MKLLLLLLGLFDLAFCYFNFVNFFPPKHYSDFCSINVNLQGTGAFNNFYGINKLENNKLIGTQSLNQIICYKGTGALNLVIASKPRTPIGNDEYIAVTLGGSQNSRISTNYMTCATKQFPQIFNNNSFRCFNIELKDWCTPNTGCVTISSIGGIPWVISCFNLKPGLIKNLRYASGHLDIGTSGTILGDCSRFPIGYGIYGPIDKCSGKLPPCISVDVQQEQKITN